MKVAKRILDVIIVILFSMIAYLLILFPIVFRKVEDDVAFMPEELHYKSYAILESDYEFGLEYNSKEEYRHYVEEEMRFKFYIYTERELKGCNLGMAIIPIRVIVLDNLLSGYEYCMVLTHEIVHLRLVCGNERYTCYETFKSLYESDNEVLHNVGVWYGMRVLRGVDMNEYDCSDLIVKYMEGKE